jgi:DNA (cytosine-5)-methyltransferase 1
MRFEQSEISKQEQGEFRGNGSEVGDGNATNASKLRCNNGCDNRQERCVCENERTTTENKPEWDGRKCGIGEAGAIVTNANSRRPQADNAMREPKGKIESTRIDGENISTNTNSGRLPIKKHGKTKSRWIAKKSVPGDWKNFPTQSPVCNGNDGISERLDSITFPKWRNESIKGGGNAIVHQVALQIFKSIEEHDNLKGLPA